MAERVLPIRTVEVELEGSWQGWKATVRSDGPSGRLMDAFQSLDDVGRDNPMATARAYLKIVSFLEGSVRAWNFVDGEGKALPLGRESLLDLPDELLMALFNAAAGAIGQAGKN